MTLARVAVNCDKSDGFQRRLLFRRSLEHPDDPRFISYYQVFAKSDTTLEMMAQIAGQPGQTHANLYEAPKWYSGINTFLKKEKIN